MPIDILLPFYGDPEYLRLAVRSVLGQTSPGWRLIVTDDCYPDASIEPWFASLNDPRVHYSRNAENLGANRNYTHALSKADSEWTVVMGADDVMLPTYVARVVELTDRFGGAADVVQPGVEVIDEHGAAVRPRVDRVKEQARPRIQAPALLRGEPLLVSLLRGNWTYFPSLCWRRAAIETIGFRPDFHVVQDLALLIDLLKTGGGLVLDDQTAFQYRRHAQSDSALKTVTGNRFAEESAYFDLIARDLDARALPRAARAARLHLTSRLHALSLVPTALAGRRLDAAVRLLRHGVALRGSPFGPWSAADDPD